MWYKMKEVEQSGYIHCKINHKYNFIDLESSTQNIERIWGSAEWQSKKYHRTAHYYVQSKHTEFILDRLQRKRMCFVSS